MPPIAGAPATEKWNDISTIADGHERPAPDFITVDSGNDGTRAAPMPLMDNMGLPIKVSLSM